MRVAQGATLIARYAYDVLGRRIAKRVYAAATGGTVGFTRFVYHGGQVAFETDSAGSTIGTRYVWGPGTDNPGGVPDQRGRDRPLLCGDRQAGQRPPDHQAGRHLVRTYGYTPYGSVAANAGSGVTLRYRWTGREWDAETGWYFHRARYYDPASGASCRRTRPGWRGVRTCMRTWGGGRWWPRTRRGLGRTRSSRSGPAIVARRVMRDGMGGLG
ncbi:MAG: hypothetical protein IPJ95_07680 [Gemmatimonadetes bacterium]|nr:hypothetical protein [Gemmatimonadota bacterium]